MNEGESNIKPKCLCVIIGESFRSGGNGSRNVGQQETVEEQKKAIDSHIRFIKAIQNKYNIDIDVVLHTAYTPYINDVYQWYTSNTNVIGYNIVPKGIGLTNAFRFSLSSQKDVKHYQSVICFRIDVFLREYIDEIFNPLTGKIIYTWRSASSLTKILTVNHSFFCLPQKFLAYLKYDFSKLWVTHDMITKFLPYKDDEPLIYTRHTAATERGWNPLLYIVNRHESLNWMPNDFNHPRTKEHLRMTCLTNDDRQNFKNDFKSYHDKLLTNTECIDANCLNAIDRDVCAVTNVDSIDTLYTFNNFPIYCGCTDDKEYNDVTTDLVIGINKRYGVLQLKKLPPLDFNYSVSHNSGIVGNTWLEHHASFAAFIRKFSPRAVLEVGGGRGVLSEILSDLKWYNVDPLGQKTNNINYVLIKQFFNKDFTCDFKYDAIVHSHTMEHMYNINEFVQLMKKYTKPQQYVIFSVPHLKEMFKKGYTNSLTFEHTVLIDENIIETLFSQNNFTLKEKQFFKDSHSIYFCFERTEACTPILFKNSNKEYNELFANFLNKNKQIVASANKQLTRLLAHKTFIFGAHVFTQFLINMGLHQCFISAAIDNDTDKIGKRLYGTTLKVKSPDVLKDLEHAIVLLYIGNYHEEIKTQLYNINKNITIITYEG